MPTLRFAAVLAVAAIVLVAAGAADAQVVEVSPAVGYRLGFSSLFYLSGTTSDPAGGISYGVAVDVKYASDRAIEALFSRQAADVAVTDVSGLPVRVGVTVDYWHGGATQEFGNGRVRPFLAGTLGLTRYWEAGISAYRFSVGPGVGVKLWATRNLGAKLDGRILEVSAGACVRRGFVHNRRAFREIRSGRAIRNPKSIKESTCAGG